MKSPFPGMDPYLEAYWGDVHISLIAYARDAIKWLETNSVLGMDFGHKLKPVRPPGALNDAQKALRYQLHERLAFVQPPNGIVGDLLFDLANILALDEAVEFAVPVYKLAVEYDAPRKELAAKRADHFEGYWNYGLSESPITLRYVLTLIVAIAAPALLALFAFFLWRSYRRRLARTHQKPADPTGEYLDSLTHPH